RMEIPRNDHRPPDLRRGRGAGRQVDVAVLAVGIDLATGAHLAAGSAEDGSGADAVHVDEPVRAEQPPGGQVDAAAVAARAAVRRYRRRLPEIGARGDRDAAAESTGATRERIDALEDLHVAAVGSDVDVAAIATVRERAFGLRGEPPADEDGAAGREHRGVAARAAGGGARDAEEVRRADTPGARQLDAAAADSPGGVDPSDDHGAAGIDGDDAAVGGETAVDLELAAHRQAAVRDDLGDAAGRIGRRAVRTEAPGQIDVAAGIERDRAAARLALRFDAGGRGTALDQDVLGRLDTDRDADDRRKQLRPDDRAGLQRDRALMDREGVAVGEGQATVGRDPERALPEVQV